MLHLIVDGLYQSPILYLVVGALIAFFFLDIRARAGWAWARTPLMVIVMGLTGAGSAYGVAYISIDYGISVVLCSAFAAWAASWALFGLIVLWRNNIVIGSILDRYFIALIVALVAGISFVYFMVSTTEIENGWWAYFAIPSLTGSLYRFLLVLLFLRQTPFDREVLGLHIEQALEAWADDHLKSDRVK